MNEKLSRVNSLISGLRLAPIDFDRLLAQKSNATPLECIELFLLEQQRQRTLRIHIHATRDGEATERFNTGGGTGELRIISKGF